jgi:hypothetical protein
VKVPWLLESRRLTSERIERRTALVASLDLPDDLALVFVGSWGRREVTAGSDNDFYLLTSEQPPADAEQVTKAVIAELSREEEEFDRGSGEFRGPGREGIFGATIVSLNDLVKKIGLQRDTNANLTHRMLLVLESIALHNPELHSRARNAVVETYLEAPIKANQPPRLFLNDVIRYWRTMCVDFAGKMRDRDGQGWGLRNVKLRTTRKLLFASGLLPLLRCRELESGEIEAFVRDQFALPPADRVADAFIAYGEVEAGGSVFSAYDRFLEKLDDDSTRAALDAIKSRAEADESELFQSMASHGEDIEEGLRSLLYETKLAETTIRYGLF